MSAARFVGRSTAVPARPPRFQSLSQPSTRRRRNRRRPRVRARPNRVRRARPRTRQMQRAASSGMSGMMGMAAASVSTCAWDYAACLMDPFSGPVACLPDSFALPSSQFRVRKVVDVVVGNTGSGLGYGFCLLDPAAAPVNDQAAIWYTDGAAVYTGSQWAQSGTGVVNTTFANGLFAAADYGAVLNQYRVVSAAIRGYYTGTVNNCNGQYVAVESTDHQSLNAINWGTITTRPGVEVHPVKAGERFMARSSGPKNPIERDFVVNYAGAGGLGPYLGILVSASASSLFSFECSVVYEIVGRNNMSPKPVVQDAVGLSYINSVLNALGPQGFQTFKDSTIWPRLVSGASTIAKIALAGSAAAAAPGVQSILSSLRQPGLGVLPRVLG